MTQLDLFAWAETRPTAIVIDALPKLLSKIRAEQEAASERPKVVAKVISMERGAA